MSRLVTLPEALDLLGYTPDEHVAICIQPPGHPFTAQRVTASDVAAHLAGLPDVDTWFGVNPVPTGQSGRGTADQVTRFAAVYADLDVKPGGLTDLAAARSVVDTLAGMLGTAPTLLTASGHGLQPIWAIDPADGGLDGQRRDQARQLLRRFGRLVLAVADRHGGTVDSVYELARVLRVPGTTNHKTVPVPVATVAMDGHPLTWSGLAESLDAYGIQPAAEDDTTLGDVVVAAEQWQPARWTCHYVRQMVDGWGQDQPPGRHPWLVSQAVRLAAARRCGCITSDDHKAAQRALTARFEHLLTHTTPARGAAPGEIGSAWAFGQARVERMTDAQARSELGNHPHLADITGPATTPAEPEPAYVVDGTTVRQLRPDPVAGTTYGPSEDGTAQHLVAAHGHQVAYCFERRSWLVWDGHRWGWDHAGQVREYARGLARALPEDAGWKAYKRRALSAAGVTAVLQHAQTDPAVRRSITAFDARPYELNTPSGIVNMRTGMIHPADPTAFHTRSTAVAPDFDRPGERWERFLLDTFGGNTELVGYVQRLLGLSAVGAVLEQILPFAHGPGANGKSTLFEAVMHALGLGDGGYAIAAPSEMLMVRKHTEHPAELAQLAGARLVVCSELDDGQRFAESRVKLLTGRDTINARFMRGNPFVFTPSHSIWMHGNHKPTITVGGPAFNRRLRLIPFSHVVPDSEQDRKLGEHLAAEAPAVLAWLIRGAADYSEHGVGQSADVATATDSYVSDEDTIGRFVDDACLVSGSEQVRIAMPELRRAYEQWCSDSSEQPASGRRFGEQLRDRFGVRQGKSHGRKFYVGIHLLAANGNESDTEGGWYR